MTVDNELPGPLDYLARNVAARATRRIARRWGASLEMFSVAEYPKSGGTWLGRMLSDCLDLPLIQKTRLPVAMPCVLHGHWAPDPDPTNTIYVYRDGRDVMVSYYFHVLRAPDHGPNKRPSYLTGEVRKDLPKFIETESRNPRSSKLAWSEHVQSWLSLEHVPRVSYEELLSDTESALQGVLNDLHQTVSVSRIGDAVDRHSFTRLSQRAPGDEDSASFLRKGIAGDWRNHFTQTAARAFEASHGNALRALGYEESETWIESLPDE